MNYTVKKLFTNRSDGNIAFHVTNDKENVLQTHLLLSTKYGFQIENLKYMNQIHSNDVLSVNEKKLYTCDALITNKLYTPLMVMVADCIPILFFDNSEGVIAVAHAGRKGTYLNISSNVIEKMINNYNCNIKNIKVELGPSIQKCCYEVSPELANDTKKDFGNAVVNGKFVDLQLINIKQLMKKGILEENITSSSICTKCGDKNYFSYRKNPQCGRFAGLIWLTN